MRYDGKFTSIKKTDEEDPLTIALDRSIELIKIKIQADKDRFLQGQIDLGRAQTDLGLAGGGLVKRRDYDRAGFN